VLCRALRFLAISNRRETGPVRVFAHTALCKMFMVCHTCKMLMVRHIFQVVTHLYREMVVPTEWQMKRQRQECDLRRTHALRDVTTAAASSGCDTPFCWYCRSDMKCSAAACCHRCALS
jgi:5-methylcytosine-specific restriction endonuclease McrA